MDLNKRLEELQLAHAQILKRIQDLRRLLKQDQEQLLRLEGAIQECLFQQQTAPPSVPPKGEPKT